jgi:ABC-type multidrug transport system fused ATPase/permease subunit
MHFWEASRESSRERLDETSGHGEVGSAWWAGVLEEEEVEEADKIRSSHLPSRDPTPSSEYILSLASTSTPLLYSPYSTMGDISTGQSAPSIDVQNLSYSFQDGSPGLQNVRLSLPAGSRTLLIGGKLCSRAIPSPTG